MTLALIANNSAYILIESFRGIKGYGLGPTILPFNSKIWLHLTKKYFFYYLHLIIVDTFNPLPPPLPDNGW